MISSPLVGGRSRPASATTTTLNSSPFAAWIVSRRTAPAPSSSATASSSFTPAASCSEHEADEALDVGAAQLLVEPGEPRELAQVRVAAAPVPLGEHGEVVVVLDDDLLAQPLEPDRARERGQPVVALPERLQQPRVALGRALGQPLLEPGEERPLGRARAGRRRGRRSRRRRTARRAR